MQYSGETNWLWLGPVHHVLLGWQESFSFLSLDLEKEQGRDVGRFGERSCCVTVSVLGLEGSRLAVSAEG